jgi:hypothetical protein
MGAICSTIGMRQRLIDRIGGGIKRNNSSGIAQNALDLGVTVTMSLKTSHYWNDGQYGAQNAPNSEITANSTLNMPRIPEVRVMLCSQCLRF